MDITKKNIQCIVIFGITFCIQGFLRDTTTQCPPGYHTVEPCRHKSNSNTFKLNHVACIACPNGTYKAGWSKASACIDCPTSCSKLNMVLTGKCEADKDNRPSIRCKCKPGYYLSAPSDDYCTPCSSPRTGQARYPGDPCHESGSGSVKEALRSSESVATNGPLTLPIDGSSFESDLDTTGGKKTSAYAVYSHDGPVAVHQPCPVSTTTMYLAIGLTLAASAIISTGFSWHLLRKQRKNHVCCTEHQPSAPDMEAAMPLIGQQEQLVNDAVHQQPLGEMFSTAEQKSGFLRLQALSSKMLKYTAHIMKTVHFKPIKIAVVDSGAALDHPAFKKLKPRIVHMENVILNQDPKNTSDKCGHGTQVLSMFATLFEHFLDVVEIVLIKAIDTAEGTFELGDLCRAMLRLLEPDMNDVKIVSISGGFHLKPNDQNKLCGLLNLLTQRKILIAASSNNGNWVNDAIAYPACAAISIGSVDMEGNRSSFSPPGQHLDFLTIGEGFTVASARFKEDKNKLYVTNKGTSLAVPVVVSFTVHFLFQLDYHAQGLIKAADYLPTVMTTRGMFKVLRQMAQHQRHTAEEGYGPLLPDEHVFFNRFTYLSVLTKVKDAPH